MPKTTLIYKWNKDLNYTDNFNLETKYYDFGTMGLKKTVYKISISFGFNLEAPINNFLPLLQVDYRTSTIGQWANYGTFLNHH